MPKTKVKKSKSVQRREAVQRAAEPEVPETVSKRSLEKTVKVVYNITEITNRGHKSHRQLEVATGSALEAEMDAEIAKQNDGQ